MSSSTSTRRQLEGRGPDYAALAALVMERFGLSLERYSPSTVRTLLACVGRRPIDEDALRSIVAACSIGETTFMRHPEQFAAVCRLAPELPAAREGSPLRVWSAGCATGEEAYSLAALLAHAAPRGVEVLGTDLNPAAIERAMGGRYRLWSLRGVDSEPLGEWLDVQGLEVNVHPWLRPYVRFEVHNLVGAGYPRDLDLVVCRNVLLYFHEAAAATVLRRFADALRPGGVLVLGYFDPEPPPDAGLEREEHSGTRMFRCPVAGLARRPALAAPPPEVAAIAPLPPRAPDAPPPHVPSPSDVHLDEALTVARGLAAQRSFAEALEALEAIAEELPLEVGPHVLAAMVADEAGSTDAALRYARRALFLSPDLAVGHYLVASCMHRLGYAHRAAVHFERAGGALREVDPATPLPYGEGLTAGQLERMIHVR